MLQSLNPQFTAAESQIYIDHVPQRPDPVKARLETVDEQVSVLHTDARRAQFEADSLSLARDVAQLGQIYREISKSEHAKRTEKVVHIRNQNVIGSSIVSEYMSNNMAVMSGVVRDQLAAMDRARGCKLFELMFWLRFMAIPKPSIIVTPHKCHTTSFCRIVISHHVIPCYIAPCSS